MCGFLFYHKKNGNISLKEIKSIKKATNLILHRGPDYKRNLTFKKNFLFHCRLSIQDINPRSHQPMIKKFKKENYNLVYNGEIYNFKNIRKKIQNKISFKTKSDTEVLLNSYILNNYKNNLLDKYSGMFSFLVLKKSKNGEIFFARDRFGQKPLYYYDDSEKIIICSEIKPLISLSKNKLEVDKNVCKEYFLRNNYFYQRETFYKNIFQVLPGECGVIKKNQIYLKKYYLNLTSGKKKSFNKGNFFNQFKKNIINHTIADKKFAISLSSGLDSQSIAHVIFSHTKVNYDVMSYTIDFEGSNFEFEDARNFTKSYDKQIKKILVTKEFLINNFENFVIKNEGPIGGIMLVGMFKLAEQTKKDGYDILFSGFGLDECLGSYKSMRKSFLSGDKFSLIDSTNVDNSKYFNKSDDFRINEIIKKYFFKYRIPRSTHFMDRISMASSVEMRIPFLDHEFVEYATSLKQDFKKVDKYLVREYMKKNSKHSKDWMRSKQHVTHPQNQWLRNGKFSNFVNDIIKENYLYKNYEFLNKKKVLSAWNKFKNNETHNGYTFWQLINLFYLKKISKKIIKDNRI